MALALRKRVVAHRVAAEPVRTCGYQTAVRTRAEREWRRSRLAASPRGAFPRRPMGVAAGAVPRAVRAATGAGGYARTAVPAVERPALVGFEVRPSPRPRRRGTNRPAALRRAAPVPLSTDHYVRSTFVISSRRERPWAQETSTDALSTADTLTEPMPHRALSAERRALRVLNSVLASHVLVCWCAGFAGPALPHQNACNPQPPAVTVTM